MLSRGYTSISGMLGLVHYAPYASSLVFLQSTGIKDRFLIGSVLFFIIGAIPTLSTFFSTIHHSVGNTILFVTYLQLFPSALRNIEGFQFTSKSIYRIAFPALLGMAIMNIPTEAFLQIPVIV